MQVGGCNERRAGMQKRGGLGRPAVCIDQPQGMQVKAAAERLPTERTRSRRESWPPSTLTEKRSVLRKS